MRILIVEDDHKISSLISQGLLEAGYQTVIAASGRDALDILRIDESIELVILDLMLPGLSGEEVLKEFRETNRRTPVLILSAKRSVEEKVRGLQGGADDYLEKPFAFSELLARIQVLLRRKGPQLDLSPKLSQFGISMDLIRREVKRDGILIELQAKEFALLEYFMRNPERVLSKTLILENVYHYNFDTQSNIIDVLIFRLRNKIDKDFDKKTIQTVRGVGYAFRES